MTEVRVTTQELISCNETFTKIKYNLKTRLEENLAVTLF